MLLEVGSLSDQRSAVRNQRPECLKPNAAESECRFKRVVLSYNIIISIYYKYFDVVTRKAELYYLTETEGRKMRDNG
jgi:hypothetical protein